MGFFNDFAGIVGDFKQFSDEISDMKNEVVDTVIGTLADAKDNVAGAVDEVKQVGQDVIDEGKSISGDVFGK